MSNQLRTIVITGALRGLGFELSKQLVQLGKYRVIVTSRDPDQSERQLYELQMINHNADIDYHELDVNNLDSIKKFSHWLQKKYTKFDVLVNNAGLKDSQATGDTKEAKARHVVTTNVHGVIHTTETLLPLLQDDGKIIVQSGIVGKLSFQKKPIQDALSDPKITREDILQHAAILLEQIRDDKLQGWNKTPETGYFASKALINCYARFVLSQNMKKNQSVYNVHPGWCRSDLGGPKAPLSVEEATKALLKLIDIVPFEFNEKLNGKFFDENGEIFDY